MKIFSGAPAIDIDYHWVSLLSEDEKERGQRYGYISKNVVISAAVHRQGVQTCTDDIPDDIGDWRIKTYVIWFCYIYENFLEIDNPMYAVEELMLEFHAPCVIDLPGRHLGALYAGASADKNLSASQRTARRDRLNPHYDKARSILYNIADGELTN